MSAEFTGDTVEIMVWAFIAVKLTGEILVGSVKLTYPCAFDRLNRIGQNHRSCLTGFFFNHAFFKLEVALRHLVFRLIPGPGKLYCFFEGLRLIINEVEGTLSVFKNVLCGVRGISATEKHCIIILACHIVGLNQ